jgi:ATP-dependent DNA ligase
MALRPEHSVIYLIQKLTEPCRDLEGIVAKLAAGRYEPAATTWVKIKNRAYSQAEGRADFFAVTSTAAKAAAATGAGAVDAHTVKKPLES